MSTVTVCVRLGSRRVLIRDEVDLDTLTPKARALAEAIHDSPGHKPLAVLCDTGKLKGDHPDFRTIRGYSPEADAGAVQPDLRLISNWNPAPKDSTTAEEWLERNARSIPVSAWPVAGCETRLRARERRVPSADAAREDRCLTLDQVILHTVDAGVPMHASGWSLLCKVGNTPPPRHLALGGRMPLWHVDDVDAYLHRDVDHWPLSQVADYLGYQGPSAQGSARKQLSRWGLQAISRAPGRSGEGRYAADQVQAAHGARPGRGRWAASRSSQE
ncbi:hypothetical protein [Streptomyces flavofungini]|uniref:hypothetical protein n=1 Tax=Streptomyces flavofungini TaxID=68200 RepID=UPI0025B000C2|nr:hypothetical protein [Streptomyces flavofungini]WJV44530.1 hypothetical protein QUY26_02680 [Streptomyces flavofungini]